MRLGPGQCTSREGRKEHDPRDLPYRLIPSKAANIIALVMSRPRLNRYRGQELKKLIAMKFELVLIRPIHKLIFFEILKEQ